MSAAVPRSTFGTEPRRLGGAAAELLLAGWPAAAAELDAASRRALHDGALAWASGRWRPGSPDPAAYVPGDVVALRAFAVAQDLERLRRYHGVAGNPGADPEVRAEAAGRVAAGLADVRLLHEAVPHFLDADAARGVLSSRPPGPEVLAEVRLPHPKVAVYLGRVFEVPAELHRWPREWDHLADLAGRPTETRTIVGDLRACGGGIEAVVLAEAPGGGLADEVLWLVSADPDPARPGTAALDRYRATVWGRLSSSHLAPVAHNLAAALAWAQWREPERSLDLPADPSSRAWRKAVRRGEFRRAEPHGAAAGVRVLDVARTPVVERTSAPVPAGGTRASPVAHLRRAHWRLQPVGPGGTGRKLVRVPATVVNPGSGPLRPVVYRVPVPDDDPAPPASARAAPAGAEGLDLRTVEFPGSAKRPEAPAAEPIRPEPGRRPPAPEVPW